MGMYLVKKLVCFVSTYPIWSGNELNCHAIAFFNYEMQRK
jgi:hypothetical protein